MDWEPVVLAHHHKKVAVLANLWVKVAYNMDQVSGSGRRKLKSQGLPK
jgi:hypothetical protein